jgi:hypothetical protein
MAIDWIPQSLVLAATKHYADTIGKGHGTRSVRRFQGHILGIAPKPAA